MNLNEIFRVARTKPEARRLGVAALVLLLVLAIAGWWLQPADAEAPRTSPVGAIARSTAAPPAPVRVDSYADVVSQVAPAVVTIRSERRVPDPRAGRPGTGGHRHYRTIAAATLQPARPAQTPDARWTRTLADSWVHTTLHP